MRDARPAVPVPLHRVPKAATPAVWVQALAGSTTLDGNTNTARTEANSNGLLVGADREFGGWQVGVLAGTGRTDVKQGEGRRARSKVDNTHFGAYASHNWGGFGLRGGLAWSEHDVDSTRELAFAGYSDPERPLRRAYPPGLHRSGLRFGGREAGLEPYVQVARVEVDTARERAAVLRPLQGSVDDVRTTLATAGVRFDKGLKARSSRTAGCTCGAVAYRHASGDRNPSARLGFATGGDSFVVNAPIADSAVVAELGLSAWLTASSSWNWATAASSATKAATTVPTCAGRCVLSHRLPQGNQEGGRWAALLCVAGQAQRCHNGAPAEPDRA